MSLRRKRILNLRRRKPTQTKRSQLAMLSSMKMGLLSQRGG
jgi:hypothetical protein